MVPPHTGKIPKKGEYGHAFSTLRRFSEENNEEAGEQFTPRDVVQPMAHLIFKPIADQVESTTYLVYDGACGTGGMLTAAEETLARLARDQGREVSIHLFGQEVNPETYAICKADLILNTMSGYTLAWRCITAAWMTGWSCGAAGRQRTRPAAGSASARPSGGDSTLTAASRWRPCSGRPSVTDGRSAASRATGQLHMLNFWQRTCPVTRNSPPLPGQAAQISLRPNFLPSNRDRAREECRGWIVLPFVLSLYSPIEIAF